MFGIILSHNSEIWMYLLFILYSCILGFDIMQDYVEWIEILQNETWNASKMPFGNMFLKTLFLKNVILNGHKSQIPANTSKPNIRVHSNIRIFSFYSPCCFKTATCHFSYWPHMSSPQKEKEHKNLKFMNIKICNLYVRSHTEMYLFITWNFPFSATEQLASLARCEDELVMTFLFGVELFL